MTVPPVADSAAPAVLTAAKRLARGKTETVTAAAAQKTFGDILNAARRKPVTVTRNGKPAAVVVSARRYREWMRVVSFIEELEDQVWLEKARRGKKSGMASRKETEAFLRELREKNGG